MARGGAKDNPSSPQVSVVVVVYESGPTLAECLCALRAQTFTDYEVLLVDNPENLGFAAAVNQGARQARGRWLALLNPDAFAEPQWLAELVAAAKANPQVHAFASRQLMAEDPTRLD